MTRPAPGQNGDQAHLTDGSIRSTVARGMRIVVITIEAAPPAQYVALLRGRDVVLTADQIRGFVQEDKRPANLDDHASWTLSGESTLTPVS